MFPKASTLKQGLGDTWIEVKGTVQIFNVQRSKAMSLTHGKDYFSFDAKDVSHLASHVFSFFPILSLDIRMH